ncbi:hypothetical protein AAG570_010932 [Ranatra chinensis]|uniref:Uncharacterized protein n=1 Tax=Ranatra chinensis TaxID=642074 RepID=A0ABD0YL96_9HEMI
MKEGERERRMVTSLRRGRATLAAVAVALLVAVGEVQSAAVPQQKIVMHPAFKDAGRKEGLLVWRIQCPNAEDGDPLNVYLVEDCSGDDGQSERGRFELKRMSTGDRDRITQSPDLDASLSFGTFSCNKCP